MSTWVNSLNNAGVQVVEEKRLDLEELVGWKASLRKGAQRLQESRPVEGQGQDGGTGDVDQVVQGQPYVTAVKGPKFAVESHPLKPGQSSWVPTGVLEVSVWLGILWQQLCLHWSGGRGDVPEVQGALLKRKEVGDAKQVERHGTLKCSSSCKGWHDPCPQHQRKTTACLWVGVGTDVVQENDAGVF